MSRPWGLLLVALAWGAPACGESDPDAETLPTARALSLADGGAGGGAARDGSPGGQPWFHEEARQRGLHFTHDSGAEGAFLMPEIMGGGAALLDVDGDGDLDAYLVQGGRLLAGAGERPPNQLFANDGTGRFEDATPASGAGDRAHGMGVACGDVDADGDTDLFVTNVGRDTLLVNDGGGRFEDRTAPSGTGHPGWSTGAAFFDRDRDGLLDLFVCTYLSWQPHHEVTCFNPTGTEDYCSPRTYQAPSADLLYANRGGGRFEDVSLEAGIAQAVGTGLGVGCADFDQDGRVDVFVANDGMPDVLWHDRGDGRFEDRALLAGCAVDSNGQAKAGMGVALADIDLDGDEDLLVGNLNTESDSLYVNEGGTFRDRTAVAGLGLVSRPFTRFGMGWVDLDDDGVLDLFEANGRVQQLVPAHGDDLYAEPNLVFRGREGARFAEVSPRGGTARPLLGTSRGAAFGDVDGDGGVDVLVVNRDAPAHLLMNRVPGRGHWLDLRVTDAAGGVAVGARVSARVGGRLVRRVVRVAYSYLSSHSPLVHLGLGTARVAEDVRVRWPDGHERAFGTLAAGQVVELPRGDAAPASGRGGPPESASPDALGEFTAIARDLIEGRNPYLGHAQVEELRGRLDAPGLGVVDRARGGTLLATELLRIGDEQAAVEAIEDVLELVEADRRLEPLARGVHRVRALAWLRRAEVENCVRRHNAECCVFPLARGGVHDLRRPAEEALESYRFCLERSPDDLKLRWLLNLVAMALGEHPGAVPEPFRIAPEAFASEVDVGRFRDVAPGLGLDAFSLCGGAVAEDFDGDGLLDLLTSSYDPREPLRLFRSRGDGSFEERTAAAGLLGQLGGLNCLGTDHDGDGDVDILVLRGAWLYDDGRIRNSLLRNEGDGTFTDVTRAAGLADPARPTQAAAWGDFENDGDLDLYVVNESRRETEGPGHGEYPSQLFLNDGGGAFLDVADQAGVTNDRYAKAVAAGDPDDDGDLDLYVSNLGANRFYRNRGDARFEDVAEAAGVRGPEGRSFATWFFDYDNDGRLDLFVAAYDARVEDVAADALGLPGEATSPRLYHNEGQGRFEDRAASLGLDRAFLPMGANFGDVNGDGWLDIYLATGDPDLQSLMPNVLLVNDRARRFLDGTTAAGLGHLQKGHGVAFADLDHDGDLDLYHQLGGFYPGDGFANALFLNPGHGHRFLTVELVGTRSVRSGHGARLAVHLETPDGPRTIHRAAGAVSSFGGSPARQEIGLGEATAIVALEVRWPASETVQIFTDVPLDAWVGVTEGREALEILSRPRLHFGEGEQGAGR